MFVEKSSGVRPPGPNLLSPVSYLQEQVRRGEKFLQPLAGWEAAELGPAGARFLARQAKLTDFSRALTRRRQRLADAERLFHLFKQVGGVSCPRLQVVGGDERVAA